MERFVEQEGVLVCFNAFKGTLSNQQACEIASEALKKKKIPHSLFPMGDGGRGTMESVHHRMGGEFVELEVSGPIFGKIQARSLLIPDATTPHTLYIQSSETCGAHLVEPSHQDVMRASSIGLGEILVQLHDKYHATIKQVVVGLGDSAISDCGMGMLSACGHSFFDASGKDIWGNAHGLRQIKEIRLSTQRYFPQAKWTVLCDVMNSLCGPEGSAAMFSPQKGASPSQVKLIEEGMENFARLTHQACGVDPAKLPMTGSSGGLASAFLAYFGAHLVQGAPYLLDWLDFDTLLEKHCGILTGEGRTDGLSFFGKAPFVCVQRASASHKVSLLVSGTLGEEAQKMHQQSGFLGAYQSGLKPNAEEALRKKILEVFSSPEIIEKFSH